MILKLRKYKIKISPESAEINTLQSGDIVNRQYFDGKNTIYSLMYVENTGIDMVADKDGVEKEAPYFIGQLLFGDEPKTGELLNFVRVTSLSNSARGGALYLTSSDSNSPYLDVINVVDKNSAVFSLNGLGSFDIPDTKTTHIQNSDEYVTEVTSSWGEAGMEFPLLNNSPHGNIVKDPVLIGFMSIKPSKDTVMEVFGTKFNLKGDEFNDIFMPIDSSDMMGSDLSLNIHLPSIGEVGDYFSIRNLIFVPMSAMTGFDNGTKTRIGQLSGIVDEYFGALDSYGAYFQKIYATKDVNIAGTLTAGSKDGQQAIFYVGKIRTNAFMNSMSIRMKDNSADIYDSKTNPVGIGNVYKSKKDSSFYANNDRIWHSVNSGALVCFSMFIMSTLDEDNYVKISAGGIDTSVNVTPNIWNRVYFYFSLPEDSKETVITLRNADVLFCAPQLELGVSPSIYQPTDEVSLLDYNNKPADYGMWATKGGFGGTIQNPIVKLNDEGVFIGDAIQATRDGVKINLKKTGIDDAINKRAEETETRFEIKEGQISSTVTKLESSLEESKKEVAKAEQTVKDAESIKTSSEQELKDAKEELKKAQEAASLNTAATGQAKDDAEQAVQDAQKKVDDAKAKADEAATEAAKAKAEADKAALVEANVTEKYTEINQTADEISTTASKVSVDASNASKSATEASSNAKKASEKAIEAENKAAEAAEEAAAALDSAGKSSKSHLDAKAKAEAAAKEAAKAKAEATKAQGSADEAAETLVDISSKQTEINQTAEEISSKATMVEGLAASASKDAESAQLKAKEAADKAAEAQLKAKEALESAGASSAEYKKAKAEAEKAVAEADKAADSAGEANAALGKVIEAETNVTQTAEEINITASKVSVDAETAKNKAAQATSEANKASSKATEAANKANEANSHLESVKKLESSVSITAEGINAKALEVSESVKYVEGVSEKAQASANSAAAKAKEAQEKADLAQSEAAKALESAGASSSSYLKAKAEADKATADALKAKNDAANAKNTQKEIIIKYNEINETAEGINIITGEVKKAANEATEAASKAQAQSSAAKLEAEKANADALKAKSQADAALASAGKSSQSYLDAKAKADEAAKKASDASAKATQAASEASKAEKEAIKALNAQKDVANKYTQIIKTADEVKLLATKAETHANQAIEAESSINLKADGIVLKASEKSAQKAIDELEIGGRNYKKNSNSSIIWAAISGSQLSFIENQKIDRFGIIDGVTIKSVGGERALKAVCSFGSFVSSDVITVSGYFKNNADTSLIIRSNQGGRDAIVKAKESKRIVFKSIESDGHGDIQFQLHSASVEIPINVTVSRVKSEKGNKATDWTPAPEDIQSQFTETNASLKVLNDKIVSEVSKTNGIRTDLTQVQQSHNEFKVQVKSDISGAIDSNNEVIKSSFEMKDNILTAYGKEFNILAELKVGNETILTEDGKIRTKLLDVEEIEDNTIVGGFVFVNGNFISQEGIDSQGNFSNRWQNFMGGEFIPNLQMNAKTGELIANRFSAIGGTIQNPIVELNDEGIFIGDAIQATRDGVKINLKKTGIDDTINKRAEETEARVDKAKDELNASISKAEQTALLAQKSVDELEIGGRNLFSINTAEIRAWISSYHIIGSIDDSTLYAIPVKPNVYYTFNIGSPYTNLLRTGYITSSEVIGSRVIMSDRNTRVPRTIKTGANATFFVVQVATETSEDAKRTIKLEKGTVATDWTPAPEDVQAEIDEAKQGVSDLGTEIGKAFSNLSITNIEANNLDLLRKNLAKEVADVVAIASSISVSVVDVNLKLTALNNILNTYTGKADSVYPITVTVANRNAINTAFTNLEASLVALYIAIENKKIDNSITNFSNTVIKDVQEQIDGKIETHFTATDPATSWTTADLKTKHAGDLWYNATTKELKRYSGTAWALVEDKKAIDAFDTASLAKDTADGKRRVFVTQPVPPYDVGDLWTQGESGDLMRCKTAKPTGGVYALADWVKASKYTDDTIAEGKSATFFAKPSVYQMGDTWYLTKDETVNGIFYRKGTMLHAAYATGQESDWRQVIYEPDATSGVNILRNYDLRFPDFLFWGSVGATIDVNVEDLPTEFYKTGFNILADEYGFDYPILDENGNEIVM